MLNVLYHCESLRLQILVFVSTLGLELLIYLPREGLGHVTVSAVITLVLGSC